ncbi:hypothetical protein M5K25_027461 [Dendrobium thyrsiflorum]|uniref:F-box domain-containing protein n=1 Tax=Dendrobium thyrsiflorum TaxID=117978 RepID=A0ABD0TZW4_DENTH
MATPRCWSSIPDDIALNIATFLEAADVCSLGSCSRFWRGICYSDFLWMGLAEKRWPMVDLGSKLSGSSQLQRVSCRHDEVIAQQVSAESRFLFPPVQGWREFYIYKHQSIARAVSAVKEFVDLCTQNKSLEAGYYLKAVSDLHSYRLGFKDVQVFLFAKRCSVLLNLIGLHYCLIQLEITPSEVMEALCRSQVSEREIYVRWFKLGRWFYGFRLQDEHHSRKISLGEIVMGKDDEVLGVLNRGAVHEVIRVHITQVNPETAVSNSVASGDE